MHESLRALASASNFRADKNVPNKSVVGERRISFFTLATLAFPGDKPEIDLAARTGRDPRTARRWLTAQHGRPDIALAVVIAEIMRRLD